MNSSEDRLPTQEDFDAIEGCLDAICAWENFGGLNLSDAFLKFSDNPLWYSEDFTFMGTVAFVYYFPVLERYIKQPHVVTEVDYEVEAIWGLANSISSQFSDPCPKAVLSLRQRVEELATTVCDNLASYAYYTGDQQRVGSAWRKLQDRMTELCDLDL